MDVKFGFEPKFPSSELSVLPKLDDFTMDEGGGFEPPSLSSKLRILPLDDPSMKKMAVRVRFERTMIF
jgi:hypothetical protein